MIKYKCGDNMKTLFFDIKNFLSSLSYIDYILYFAVLVLVILIVSLIYLIKTTSIEEEIESIEDQELDLKATVDELNKAVNSDTVILTDYEKDQEEKAIISYEELVSSIKKKDEPISYQAKNDEFNPIRKIELSDIYQEENKNIKKVKVLDFRKEEEFLRALKNLNEQLN